MGILAKGEVAEAEPINPYGVQPVIADGMRVKKRGNCIECELYVEEGTGRQMERIIVARIIYPSVSVAQQINHQARAFYSSIATIMGVVMTVA